MTTYRVPLLVLPFLFPWWAMAGEYEVVGDPVTHTYYLPRCPGYQKVQEQPNRRLFRNPHDAQTSDYDRAASCATVQEDRGLAQAVDRLNEQLRRDGTSLTIRDEQPPPTTMVEHLENRRKDALQQRERDRAERERYWLLYDNVRTYRFYPRH